MIRLSHNFKYLFLLLACHRKTLAGVFCSLITVACSLLLIGTVFRQLIDQAININNINEIYRAIFLISGLIIIFAVGSFFRSYFINKVTIQVIAQLREEIYASLLTIDISKYEGLKIGDLVTRLSADMELISNLIINILSFFLRNSILLLGALVLMFTQTIKLSLLISLLLPVLLLPLLKLSRYVRSISRLMLQKQGELSANIDEIFSGIRTIYAYNQQKRIERQFILASQDHLHIAVKRQYFRSMFFALAILLIAGTIITIIAIGSIDIVKNQMSAGQMVSFIYYAMMVGSSAGGIAELFSELQSPLAALDRVMELKQLISKRNRQVNRKLINTALSLKFEEVSFSYPTRPNIKILDRLSFIINSGEFVGIAGPSGAGKSSIMQLIIKFYLPSTGDIKFNNDNIKQIETDSIRQKVAYIEQMPTIFSGTIRENIIFANQQISAKKLEEIIEITDIKTFSDKLKDGIDTEIGQKGVRLSGGQKQRIAIARALAYQPEILMLDEATSALDNESEKLIMFNIRKLLAGKTIIAIAHRLSSVKEADQILLINQGCLESAGSHQQLLSSSKLYNILYQQENG